MSSSKKTGRSIIISLFKFCLYFIYLPRKNLVHATLPKNTLLAVCILSLVLHLAAMNIIYTLLRIKLGGRVGSGCHWALTSLEWNMRLHLSTLYTLYHMHPTCTCAYNVLQWEIIFCLIRKLKWHKIHLPPHTLKQPHYTYLAMSHCLVGCVATGVATSLITQLTP